MSTVHFVKTTADPEWWVDATKFDVIRVTGDTTTWHVNLFNTVTNQNFNLHPDPYASKALATAAMEALVTAWNAL